MFDEQLSKNMESRVELVAASVEVRLTDYLYRIDVDEVVSRFHTTPKESRSRDINEEPTGYLYRLDADEVDEVLSRFPTGSRGPLAWYINSGYIGTVLGFARLFATQGKKLCLVLEDLPPLDEEVSFEGLLSSQEQRSMFDEELSKNLESRLGLVAADVEVHLTHYLYELDVDEVASRLPTTPKESVASYINGEHNDVLVAFARIFATQGKWLHLVLEDLPPLDEEVENQAQVS